MNKNLIMAIEHKLVKQIELFEIPEGSKQRTIGDLISHKIQEIVKELNRPEIKEYVLPKSKLSMENFVLIESNGTINYFDVITHDINANFSMPNLTSINHIRNVFKAENKNLFYIFVAYNVSNKIIRIQKIDIKSVWELDFSNLRIGSLGKGQLQIKNMNKNFIFRSENRNSWFNELTNLVKIYHETRIKQIRKDSLQWA